MTPLDFRIERRGERQQPVKVMDSGVLTGATQYEVQLWDALEAERAECAQMRQEVAERRAENARLRQRLEEMEDAPAKRGKKP